MIDVIIPDLKNTRRIQEEQGAYYWSRLTELLFRREGIISVRRVTSMSDDCTAQLICRDVTSATNHHAVPRVLEGPIQDDFLAVLGLSANDCQTDTLVLNKNNQLAIHMPEILVRNADKSTSPLLLDSVDAKWRNEAFKVQFLEGPGWDPVLHAVDPASGQEGVVAIRRGNDLVFGFSIFDLLAKWLAVPPLEQRYGGFSRLISHSLISTQIIELIVTHITSRGAPHPLRVGKWPRGYTSALTVRHDYDRKADRASVQELVEHYTKLGIKSSIGILPYFTDQETINLFQDKGHEIQAHIASPNKPELREDISRLSNLSLQRVKGVTIHGGPDGIGFRGQTHFEWLDDMGLNYCETFGLRDTIPVQAGRIYDGIPDNSNMMVTPGHFSMDGSTHPKDHRLEALIVSIPKSIGAGNYTIIMNHPDIHLEELQMLLSNLKLNKVWCATTNEVVQWHRITRYTSLVDWTDGEYILNFSDSIQQKAELKCDDVSIEVEVGLGAKKLKSQ